MAPYAARNFANLYAVGGRQHSIDTVAKVQVVRNLNTEARITMGNRGKKKEETTGLLDWCWHPV